MCYIEMVGQQHVMGKRQQVVLQEQKPRFTPILAEEPSVSRLERLFKKVALAAITMLGIGYVLINAPIALLLGYSVSSIPISSQANVIAISGRIMFLIASTLSAFLGVLFVFAAVQFYEHGKVKGVAFLGVSIASFYLLCLGVGSTLLLSEANLATLALTTAPLIAVASTALYTSPNPSFKLAGSVIGIAGGSVLAYAIFNLHVLDLVFAWDIPFTGPFLALTILESAVVALAPIAAAAHAIFSHSKEELPISHVFTLLIALVYGLGALAGSIVLSMSFWNWIWQSPWTGPFYGLPDVLMNIIVFWSASLVLMDISGVLLIAVACLGFICVGRELSKR